MAMSGGQDDGMPMMEMNMTPLIDVLLVLLIMFIITIPIQTHAVKIDLPVNSDQNNPPPIDPIKNTVSVDPYGTVTWNGTPIDMVTLRLYL
jgi:biopolymer transport protein ExbD